MEREDAGGGGDDAGGEKCCGGVEGRLKSEFVLMFQKFENDMKSKENDLRIYVKELKQYLEMKS